MKNKTKVASLSNHLNDLTQEAVKMLSENTSNLQQATSDNDIRHYNTAIHYARGGIKMLERIQDHIDDLKSLGDDINF